MKIIWNLVLVFMSIISLFYVVYFFLKIHEHRSTRNKRRSNAEKAYSDDKQFLQMITEHINRTFVFYYSYLVNTAMNMYCKIMGLLFSVASFSLQVLSDLCIGEIRGMQTYRPFMGLSISLLTVVFVIVIIYVKPQKRSAQYLHAWRKMNFQYNRLVIEYASIKEPNSCVDLLQKEATFLHEIEASLKEDIDS